MVEEIKLPNLKKMGLEELRKDSSQDGMHGEGKTGTEIKHSQGDGKGETEGKQAATFQTHLMETSDPLQTMSE